MNIFENLHISFALNPIFLLIGFLLALGYSVFVYRTTLPPIRSSFKIVLVSLRTFGLFLILLLFFDPVINSISKEKIIPRNFVFIDNSKSVKEISSDKEIEKIENLIQDLRNEDLESEFFLFGNDIKEFQDTDSLNFSQSASQFDNIIKKIKSAERVSSVVIISDGINNQGENPRTLAEEIGIPIFTIGLGDSTSEADLAIQKISANEYIYAGRETEIEVSIINKDLHENKVNIQLIENQKIIAHEEITLSTTGINRVRFPYSSNIDGEHKITVNAVANYKEKNQMNNNKTTIINILATKKKIAIIAGAPSSDLSFVTSSLSKNENYQIQSIIEIGSQAFLNNQNDIKIIKDSDLIFFVGFPSEKSDLTFVNKIAENISSLNKPFFFIFSLNLNIAKLGDLSKILPFKFSKVSNTFTEVQVNAISGVSSFIGSSAEQLNKWKSLPPISLNRTKITPNIESQILLVDNTINEPILFTNSGNSINSIVLTAANFWKWKLQPSEKNIELFDNLLINSIKWLSLQHKSDKLSLSTQKKSFNLGEKVVFSANYYSDTFDPISDANIEVELGNENQKQKISLQSLGNGLYEAEYIPNISGYYKYKSVINNIVNQDDSKGSFLVEPIELELVQTQSNRELLRELSQSTSGKYYDINNFESLLSELVKEKNEQIHYNSTDNELRLSFMNLILLSIVLLFSAEWILRKMLRMI